LAWAAIGEGPGLLVPSCNFPWLDTAYVAALAAHFTVVVASPRGYGRSTRLNAGRYRSEMLARDLLAVTTAAGAVLAFYRELARLPDGALVDRLSCPVMSFWGSSDEVIGSFGVSLSELEIGLSARDVGYAVVPDLDHLGTLLRLDEVLPEVCAWLVHAIA